MSPRRRKFSIRDLVERVVWTFVQGALGAVTSSALLDVEIWKAAVFAGVTAMIAVVTVIARWRLSVLPDPGAGLPGLPVAEEGGV